MPKGLRRMAWETRAKPLEQLLPDPVEVSALPVEARSELLETIHEEIIPQLVIAHHRAIESPSGDPAVCTDARPPPTEDEVLAFAELAVTSDLARTLTFVEKLGSQGLSLEVVLLQLISPAARVLGDQWLSDERSFSEVTMGLSTLQQLVHVLGPSFAPGLPDRGLVVLASPLSEQHTLGIYILGEFLRRAGWGVRVAPSLSEAELEELVASEEVVMAGISVSSTDVLKSLDRLVAKLKATSLNRSLVVMVGGAHPDLADHATRIGAIYGADAPDTVRKLEAHTASDRKLRDGGG